MSIIGITDEDIMDCHNEGKRKEVRQNLPRSFHLTSFYLKDKTRVLIILKERCNDIILCPF